MKEEQFKTACEVLFDINDSNNSKSLNQGEEFSGFIQDYRKLVGQTDV